MSEPYIKRVRVQDFGCVKDATLELTRLHALIGPNDSGKTTLLRAVRTAMTHAHELFLGQPNPAMNSQSSFDDGLISTSTSIDVSLALSDAPGELHFTSQQKKGLPHAEVSQQDKVFFRDVFDAWAPQGGTDRNANIGSLNGVGFFQRNVQWIHFSAAAMRDPAVLFKEGDVISVEQDGRRLPAVYDAILNRGDDTFLNIAREVRSLFPSVKNIRLKNIATDTKAFEIELISGQRVPASFVSDGVLYFLAFAALEHLSPVSVVLLEEPENGLHPARIADVMRVLRRISERVQVILATHSPFVINELQGDEVTVVTRPDGQGTRVRRFCDTPNFEERSKVYALGELWVSYADGKNEEPLLAEVEGGS